MEKTYVKLFRDKKVLQEMLELVKQGYSYSFLSRKFGVDRSSILYQVRKHKIERLVKITKPKFPKSYPQDGKLFKLKDYYVDAFTKEKINTGLLDYKSYIKAEQDRKWKEFINKPTAQKDSR